ncbi:MAG: tyrosine-type recombinase/integrase [Solirubrobacteraceae bacterium]
MSALSQRRVAAAEGRELEVVVGELVCPAAELVDTFCLTRLKASTAATYRSACGRFVGWLVDRHGPRVGPEQITVEGLAAYQQQLRGAGASEFTVRKDRAAINTFIRWLVDHEQLDAGQARLALSVQSPRPSDADARRAIIALTVAEYERLLTQAHAQVATDPLLGWRDVAIIRTLGECGLRAEELCYLERRDYRPTRKGADKRELHVRHGKGSRMRSVPASHHVRRALVRWDQLRRHQIDSRTVRAGEHDPLFVTIGVRRRDGGYSALGRPVTYDTIAEVIKRLGDRAGLPDEKRHPHVLRHTFATRYYHRHRDLAGLQRLLGHADIRTTMRYVHVTEDLHDNVESAFSDGLALDEDAAAG